MSIFSYVCFNRTKGMKDILFKNLDIGKTFYCKSTNEWYRKIDNTTAILLDNNFTYKIPAEFCVYVMGV
jgi:hypothetical protein